MIDTGSCANAIPQVLLENLQKQIAKLEFIEPSFKNVKLASGSPVSVSHAVRIHFEIAKHNVSDDFIVLPTVNTVIIGNPFFKKNSIWICPSNNLLKLPDITVQLNENKPKNQKSTFLKKLKKIPIFLSKKPSIPPNSHKILECTLRENSDQFSECSGVVIPNEQFGKTAEIALTSSLSTIDEKGRILISAINISDHYVHIKADTLIASFEILNQSPADRLINIDPQLIALAKMRDPNDLENGLNQLVQVDLSNQKTRPSP